MRAITKKVLTLWLVYFLGTSLATASSDFDDIDRYIRLRQYQKAAQLLYPLVRQNDAKAEFMLAGFYRAGKGVKKSLKIAESYYEKAAQHGSAKAQYTLATLLSKKPPSIQNQKAVLSWYQQAAAQGHVWAQKKLKGLGLKQASNKVISKNDIFSLIITNDFPEISALIESGVSLDIKDAQSRIPLQVALLAKNETLAQSLLKVTSIKNINNCTKDLPLHLAISNGYDAIARDLVRMNVRINAVDLQGNNALVIATRHKNVAMVKLLLEHNGNPLLENNSRSSAVQLAQTLGYQKLIKEFDAKGFKPKAKKITSIENKIEAFQRQISSQKSLYKGWPLINVASLLGDSDMALYLLKNTKQSGQKDSNGMTALHRASASGHLDIVKMLIDNSFKVNAINKKHQTPLFLASRGGHVRVVKYFLQKQADSSIHSSNQSTALNEALAHEHYKTSALLINKENNQEIINSAAFLTIKQKQQSLSTVLIKKLKRKDSADKYGRNLLWYAVDNNLKKVVTLLLREGKAIINKDDINGYSPLAQSIKKSATDMALQLIAEKASLSGVTKEKNTLLMLAALNDNKALVTALLNKNVSLNLKNNFGNTALMIAAKNGFNSIIQQLLASGANSKLRDNNDKNAYQLALAAKHIKSAQIISESRQLFKIFN